MEKFILFSEHFLNIVFAVLALMMVLMVFFVMCYSIAEERKLYKLNKKQNFELRGLFHSLDKTDDKKSVVQIYIWCAVYIKKVSDFSNVHQRTGEYYYQSDFCFSQKELEIINACQVALAKDDDEAFFEEFFKLISDIVQENDLCYSQVLLLYLLSGSFVNGRCEG